MPNTEHFGDVSNLVFKAFPAYSLGSVIFFNSMNDILVEYRDGREGNGLVLSKEDWTIENVSGDVLSLILHFIVWSCMLAAIEGGLGTKI
jgi:hypothetical protein